MKHQQALRITEIFYSLQGESTLVGLPTVFVRLTGCPLRCQYCDSAYAFAGGKRMSLQAILTTVASYSPHYVTVTGGEPLAQPECFSLLTTLCDQGYTVSLETSGAMDIGSVDQRVITILDIKTPGSNEVARNLWENFYHLKPIDQIKFVICNRYDYDWAKSMITQYQLVNKAALLFSPSHPELVPKQLAEWILEDRLNVRMQLQVHKYIWGDLPGH